MFNPNLGYLRQCIDSLVASTEVELDVIVVDNDSDAVEVIRSGLAAGDAPVQLLRLGANRGFAAGVNAGLRQASGTFVWLLNDDAWVEPDGIAAAVSVLSQAPPRVLAVAPKVLVAGDPRRIIDSVGNVLLPSGEGFNLGIGQPDLGQFDVPERCFGVCFAAGLFRRSAFADDAVGMLDERYFLYYEDIDWSLRANRAGFTFRTAPTAVAYHRHSVSTRSLGLAGRYRIVERNLLINAAKNLQFRSAVKIWLRRIYLHTRGLLGSYRLARWQALGGATIRLPGLLLERSSRRDRTTAMTDQELFAFAEGEQPFFDSSDFQAANFEAAQAAAVRRLQRSQRLPQRDV